LKFKDNKSGPTFEIEAGLFCEGYRCIAGADEAGRGSLAGPLTVGFVVFDSAFFTSPAEDQFSVIDDSKKLTSVKRDLAFDFISRLARIMIVEHISPDLVDKLNPNRATKYALDLLLEKTSIRPDLLLMDGTFKFSFPCEYRAVKKGDSLSLSIAAASIAAKVSRDRLMNAMDPFFPDYGFKMHKGYGTAFHLEAIRENGPSSVHRKSYEPVKSMLPGDLPAL
jgi:ribonuclease HII